MNDFVKRLVNYSRVTILSRIVESISTIIFRAACKKYIAYLLVCQVLIMPVFSVQAAVASPSNAEIEYDFELASASDAQVYFEPVNLYDYLDVPTMLSDGDVVDYDSTIWNPTRQKVTFRYYDMSNKIHDLDVYCDSNGYFSFGTRPADFARSVSLIFWLTDIAPPSGKYRVSFSFGSNTGGHTYSSCSLWSQKTYSNATPVASSVVVPLQQFSGDASGSVLVDYGSPRAASFNLGSTNMGFPFGGYLKIRFERLVDQAAPTDYSTAGGPTTSQDVQQNIAGSSSEIASNTASMADTLKEIVQTISHQLASLWDQMFNLMHVPQLANDNRNTDRLIQNQDDNTNQVTESIENHGNFIIEGLKGLFIPSDTFFKDYFDDLYSWFSDKFGFLTIPLDVFIRIMGMFTASDQVDFVLTLPPLSVMDEVLWTEQSFNFTQFLNEHFAFLVTAIQTGTSILLILSFIDLCRKKYDEVMRN